jgi:hypothetical protein
MLVTPYDLQDKIIAPISNNNENINTFSYTSKIRCAFIVFILFIILSYKVAFKVLDLILKVFANNINILDADDNPLFVGTIIMAIIFAIFIFIFC